jgi:hypothetical protein
MWGRLAAAFERELHPSTFKHQPSTASLPAYRARRLQSLRSVLPQTAIATVGLFRYLFLY